MLYGMNTIVALYDYLPIFAAGLVFFGVLYFLSRICGWSEILERRGLGINDNEGVYGFSSIGVLYKGGRFVNLKCACKVCVGDQGVRFVFYFPFSIFFSPVFIRWGTFKRIESDKNGWVVLSLDGQTGLRQIAVMGNAGKAIFGRVPELPRAQERRQPAHGPGAQLPAAQRGDADDTQ